VAQGDRRQCATAASGGFRAPTPTLHPFASLVDGLANLG
jgi:hypothetical protein